MKVSFIGHAAILIEINDVKILSDPWWRGPCFGAQWWIYPAPYLTPLEGQRIDYIYISHAHHDHLHPATLKVLNHDAKVLVSEHWGIAKQIRDEGFEVIELAREECRDLGAGVSCRIMPTFGGDSLMAVTDGHEVCLNLNDALHSAPQAVQSEIVAKLKQLYPKITYVFCGYGIASHFPNCYMVPDKNREASAGQRQRYFNRQWAKLIAALSPEYGFPFAADVALLENDLFWANEPTHNTERPTDTLRMTHPHCMVTTRDIAPGFTVLDGKVISDRARQPINALTLRATYQDEINKANRYGVVESADIDEVLALLKKNLAHCAEYLRSFEGDYRCFVRLRNSQFGIAFSKSGASLDLQRIKDEGGTDTSHDVIFTTRLPYLRQSLTLPFGDEVMFVGSGCLIEYNDREGAKRNIHKELIKLVSRHTVPMMPRTNPESGHIRKIKHMIKRMLGRVEIDLYDLDSWTVYKSTSGN